ncbi:IS91 family transposase [Aureliella helgolandensis]|uniref:Transposase n=1 Tax=Aureliella helgolandensis TaxID=2527968 RepID=A0A518GG51_9BACT|nr:transposase [Aureliella helgolandensis]QDV27569.1 Putative transposase [Aureliella helgolandensis]
MKPSVSTVLKCYGQQYLNRYGCTMTAQQKKVLRAVMACREESLGAIRYRCLSCDLEHTVPRSCCNRHCAACQHEKVQEWLEKQQDRLLPCHYFLITFTVPKEVREAMLAHPEDAYPAMLGAAAESLKQSATNPRHVGVKETGFFGVLHTWGRDLTYHPHVHFVVPGGGIDSSGEWQSSRESVFVPEQILSVLFRNKLRDRLTGTECFSKIPASVWKRLWTVDSQPVGNGRATLKYLAPYVARGPVSDWRVSWCNDAESLENARLTLQVKKSGSDRYRGMPLTVTEFIRRWLMHVLPAGMHRIRSYGLLHSSNKRSLEEVRLLIAVALGTVHYLLSQVLIVQAESPKLVCPQCGGSMTSLGYFPPIAAPIKTAPRAPP